MFGSESFSEVSLRSRYILRQRREQFFDTPAVGRFGSGNSDGLFLREA